MSTENGDRSNDVPNTRWEGYSDYQQVSGGIVRTIESAVEAYAAADAALTERGRVDPQLASDARAAITAAAMKLHYEMEQDREQPDKPYDEILDRWEGEDGFLEKWDNTKLTSGRPSWLYEFVSDIRKAGWELGYLQAGRETRTEGNDPVEEETDQMF